MHFFWTFESTVRHLNAGERGSTPRLGDGKFYLPLFLFGFSLFFLTPSYIVGSPASELTGIVILITSVARLMHFFSVFVRTTHTARTKVP